MELILWLLVSYYLANNLVTNTAYAVRGLDPPRHKERMARLESGGKPSSRYQSGRNGASRFFAEAWHDAWDDAHGKRRDLREKRQVKKAGKDAEPQPDGAVDTPGALRPQEPAQEHDGNVISLATRTRRPSPSSTRSSTATGPHPSATDQAGPAADVAASGPAPQPDGVLNAPGALRPQVGRGARTADPTVSPDAQDPVDEAPPTMAEPPQGMDAGAPSGGEASTERPMPQPDGGVEGPGALRPAPGDTDAAGATESDTRGSRQGDSAGEPEERPTATHPDELIPQNRDRDYGYPSMFTTWREARAHFGTLPPETQQVLEDLNTRLKATPPDLPIPLTIAEESAMLQARGYPQEIAQQAAEQGRAAGRSPAMSRPERFPDANPAAQDRFDPEHDRPAADGRGAAATETRKGNSMSVMTTGANSANQPPGETAGLGSAIRFASGMASAMRDAVARTEQSIGSLGSSEVGYGPIVTLNQAMELAGNAATAFEQAQVLLEKQLSVKEAYDATPDAGNKRFLQND